MSSTRDEIYAELEEITAGLLLSVDEVGPLVFDDLPEPTEPEDTEAAAHIAALVGAYKLAHAPAQRITIRIKARTLAAIKALAKARGKGYQTMINKLLDEALAARSKSAA